MDIGESLSGLEEFHPIDLVEALAAAHRWHFDRMGEDQIAMVAEGRWRSYPLTLAFCPQAEMLRLVLTFEMTVPEDRRGQLLDCLNRANESVWTGAFSLWEDQALIVWRHALLLDGGASAGVAQVDRMLDEALTAAERFYPVFQLVAWGDEEPAEAMRLAIAETVGHA